MKVVLRTRVGTEAPDFHRPDEMSPSMQKFYRQTVRRFSARPAAAGDTAATIVPKLMARIIVNGSEYESAGQLPPLYRRIYEETLARALPLDRAIDMVVRTEHANFITRALSLSFIAAGLATTIVYLWIIGHYA